MYKIFKMDTGKQVGKAVDSRDTAANTANALHKRYGHWYFVVKTERK